MPEAIVHVELLAHTYDPEQVVVAAIRQCYSGVGAKELKEKTDASLRKKLISQIISSGHHSTIEHASFTFAIEGISRACTHQLVRHRIASYSHQSQRYVNFTKNGFDYVMPPTIRARPELKDKFDKFIKNTAELYTELVDAGIPKEDARFILPNASETKIVVTMNARSLLNFLQERTCNRAQWEIRMLALKMQQLVKEVAPEIFAYSGPTCVTEKICWQGDLACNRWKTIKGAELRNRSVS